MALVPFFLSSLIIPPTSSAAAIGKQNTFLGKNHKTWAYRFSLEGENNLDDSSTPVAFPRNDRNKSFSDPSNNTSREILTGHPHGLCPFENIP